MCERPIYWDSGLKYPQIEANPADEGREDAVNVHRMIGYTEHIMSGATGMTGTTRFTPRPTDGRIPQLYCPAGQGMQTPRGMQTTSMTS